MNHHIYIHKWYTSFSLLHREYYWVPLGILYISFFTFLHIFIKLQAQHVRNDPFYLNCTIKECQAYKDGKCLVHTCSGSLTFHVVNIRTDIEFAFFAGGFDTPCILARSTPATFASPQTPLYGHLSSIDSTGTSVSNLKIHNMFIGIPIRS